MRPEFRQGQPAAPLNQKISIASAQLLGLKANLYQQTAQSKHNFQFVLDSLASKDTTKHTPLDLHIGSLIIRHGAARYDKRYIASKSGVFSPAHISISDLSTTSLPTISLMMLSICISRNLAFRDKSGLQLNSSVLSWMPTSVKLR